MTYKMLDRRVDAAENRSDVIVTEIGQIGEHKLSMTIRSNAYKAQGQAAISRFDGAKWQQIARIVPEAMKTREGLIYRVKKPIVNPSNPTPIGFAEFAEDHAELIRQAELILG